MIIDGACYFCGADAILFITVGERGLLLCAAHARDLFRELREHV